MKSERRFCRFFLTLIGLSITTSALGNGPDDVSPTPEEMLEQMGISTSLPSLESVVLNDRYETGTRGLAAVAIGRSKDQMYMTTLVSLLSDPNPDLRGAAIIGLRYMGAKSAVPHLARILKTDQTEFLQQVTIPALEAIGGERAVDALVAAASNLNKSEGTRVQALSAIQRLQLTDRTRYDRIKDSLASLLHDGSVNVRSMAAHAMAAAEDKAAIPHLVDSALNDRTERWIKTRAISDLERLTNQRFGYFKSGRSRAAESKQRHALREIELWWAENGSKYKQ